MPKASVSTEVPAEPERVWAVLNDFARLPEWFVMHVRFVSEPPATPAAGATFRQGVTILGIPGEIAWTLVTVRAPSRVELAGQGPLGIALRATFDIAAAGAGSRVAITFEFSGGLLSGPLGAAVEKQARKDAEASLGKLGALSG